MAITSASMAFAYNSDIAISTTAKTLIDIGFTTSQIDSAVKIRLTVEAQPVRYRYDGAAPTATEGHPLIATDELIIYGQQNIEQFQIIRSGASDATVRVTMESL